MLEPETTLLIGLFAGALFGYAVGFTVARMIYRSPNWPAWKAALAKEGYSIVPNNVPANGNDADGNHHSTY